MRSPTIDTLRGLAVAGMIVFHTNYLLEQVFLRDIILIGDAFWDLLGPSVAILFISLAGVVSVLSAVGKPPRRILDKTLKRTLILATCALAITIVTYTLIPEQRISWGILHFLTLASVLGLITLRAGYLTLILGIIVLIVPYLSLTSLSSPWLIPLGFPPLDYYSADYYPLIPWMGYYLIGQGIGYALSRNTTLLASLDSRISQHSFMAFLGRHALVVYMVHVPILYGVM
jgi:uncharacterized membrane protein